MLNCLTLPPNPNFDPPLSGVATTGPKCTTLPGVISNRLSGAGIGSVGGQLLERQIPLGLAPPLGLLPLALPQRGGQYQPARGSIWSWDPTEPVGDSVDIAGRDVLLAEVAQ
eukprot:3513666-Rhodomonas_salina.1